MGKSPSKRDEKMTEEMKQFLYNNFGTTKVSDVDKNKLKEKLEGPTLIERINHRRAVAVNYKK